MSSSKTYSMFENVLSGLVLTFGLSVSASAQANSPTIPANIEQSSSITAHHQSSVAANGVTAAPEDFSKIRLAPGFLLQMDVYDIPEFSLSLRVDANGDVSVPLIGPVHVAGMTVFEAQTRIAQVLVREEILKVPQVALNIVQYSTENVSILGEVQNPGRIQLLAPKSLQDVLALAGGETIAAGNLIEIQRNNAAGDTTGMPVQVLYSQGGDASQLRATLINPGDSIYVRRAGVIYVLGAVNRPGGYLMVNGGTLNLLEAVSLAAGTSLQASMGTVRVIRPHDGKYTEIDVPYSKVTKGEVPPMKLQTNDIVYVSTSIVKTVLINGSAVLGAAAGAAIYNIR